jgi:HemK-like putative methylase
MVKLQGPNQRLRILDLCAGSGCIGLGIATTVENVHVDLVDLSAKSVKTIRKNIALLSSKLAACRSTAAVIQMDYLNDCLVSGPYHLIVSNPPYISRLKRSLVQSSVINHEPKMALFPPGGDGTFFHKKILEDASALLDSDKVSKLPRIVFECDGPYQFRMLARAAKRAGFTKWIFKSDIFGVKRFMWIF